MVRVSVIIRSYNRIKALCELIERLLSQDHDAYEVIVIEQSTDYSENDWSELQKLGNDERVKIYRYNSPLGGPSARNEGVRHASGEILVFIDDDDLPVSEEWIQKHEKAYEDDNLVGFTGRHVSSENASCPYLTWMRWFIRRKCMSYSFLKTPYTFARFDEDICGVQWLHGTNSSIRKSWALKAGLWDTNVKNQDEHSLSMKLNPMLAKGRRLDFKKEPALIRRMDIKGGMGKRNFSVFREFRNQYDFVTKIIYKYYPYQKLLFPVHLIWIVFKCFKYAAINWRDLSGS